MKIALHRISTDIKTEGLRSRVLMQIHDELVVEVAPGEWDAAERIVREQMSGAAQLSVPLDVQLGRGVNWDEAGH
jgi:DNA polymerase-1